MELFLWLFYSLLCLFILTAPIILIVFLINLASKSSKNSNSSLNYKSILDELKILNSNSVLDKDTYNKIYLHFENLSKPGIPIKEESSQDRQLVEKALEKKEIKSEIKVKSSASKPSALNEIFSDFSTGLLFYLGSFLVITSAITLVAFNWGQFSSTIKLLILPIFYFIFLILGITFVNIKKLIPGGRVFIVISACILPLLFLGLWRFKFSDININFALFWAISSVIYSGIFIIYDKFLKNVTSKLLLVFGIINFFTFIPFAFEYNTGARFLAFIGINALFIILSKTIPQKFYSILFKVLSFTLYSLIAITLLFFFLNTFIQIVESNSVKFIDKFLLSADLIAFSSITFLIYLLYKKVETYIPLIPSIFLSLFALLNIWQADLEFQVISVSFLGLLILIHERYLKLTHSKLTSINTIFAHLTISFAFLLNLLTGFDNYTNLLILSASYLLIFVYLIIRYLWEKEAIYLGIASLATAFPFLQVLSNIETPGDLNIRLITLFIILFILVSSLIFKIRKKELEVLNLLPSGFLYIVFATFQTLTYSTNVSETIIFHSLCILAILILAMLSKFKWLSLASIFWTLLIYIEIISTESYFWLFGILSIFTLLSVFIQTTEIKLLNSAGNQFVKLLNIFSNSNLIAISSFVFFTLLKLHSDLGIEVFIGLNIFFALLSIHLSTSIRLPIFSISSVVWILSCIFTVFDTRASVTILILLAVFNLLHFVLDLSIKPSNKSNIFARSLLYFSAANLPFFWMTILFWSSRLESWVFLIGIIFMNLPTFALAFKNKWAHFLVWGSITHFISIVHILNKYNTDGYFTSFILTLTWILPYLGLFIYTSKKNLNLSSINKTSRILYLTLTLLLFILIVTNAIPISDDKELYLTLFTLTLPVLIDALITLSSWPISICIYMLVIIAWQIGARSEITNVIYYSTSLALGFHINNLLLRLKNTDISKSGIFTMMGIISMMTPLLLLSITDALYLVVLIGVGIIYIIIWPIFKNKIFAFLPAIFLSMGVIINLATLIITFPQWLIIGITGITILFVGIIFLIIKPNK